MRRKQALKLGQRTKLSLVTQAVPLEAPVLLTPLSPASSVGLSAAAVAQDEDSHESLGGDWPARPQGVSDEALYTEWLRLHTPKASVSGKKLSSGVTKRTPASYSNIVLPRAMAINNGGFAIPNANVVSLSDQVNRENNAHASRYRSGAAKGNVKELVNAKASAYCLDCHKHTVRVWNKVVGGIVGKSIRDHQGYDFKDRLAARRMEWHEDRMGWGGNQLEVPWEAANDASVVESFSNFVGPVQPVREVSVSAVTPQEDAETVMNVLDARRYNERRRELEEVFSNYTPPEHKKVKLSLDKPQYLVAPVESWGNTLRSYFLDKETLADRIKQDAIALAKKISASSLSADPESLKALMDDSRANVVRYQEVQDHEYVRSMRALLKDWNSVKGQNHSAVMDRSIQYQYMLKSIKKSIHGTIKAAEPISRSECIKLFNAGHLLVGHNADGNTYFPEVSKEAVSSGVRSRWHYYLKRKRELEQAFAYHMEEPALLNHPSKPTDEALSKLYSRLMVQYCTAKEQTVEDVLRARFKLFGMEFKYTESGLILPA